MSDKPDKAWLGPLYPKDAKSPEHLDRAILQAAHESVKSRFGAWYGIGAAATIVLAVALTFVTLESPWDGQSARSTEQAAAKAGAPQLLKGEPATEETATESAALRSRPAETSPNAPEEVGVTRARLAAPNVDTKPAPAAMARVQEERSQARLAADATAAADTLAAKRMAPVASDQVVTMGGASSWRFLPDCSAKIVSRRPTLCNTADSTFKVLDPLSGACPKVLPPTIPRTAPPTRLEVLSTDPRAIKVNDDQYVCLSGAWRRR